MATKVKKMEMDLNGNRFYIEPGFADEGVCIMKSSLHSLNMKSEVFTAATLEELHQTLKALVEFTEKAIQERVVL